MSWYKATLLFLFLLVVAINSWGALEKLHVHQYLWGAVDGPSSASHLGGLEQ